MSARSRSAPAGAATVAALHAAYRAGAATPLDIAEAFLAARPVGGDVDAFVSVDPEDVRRQAAASAERLAGRAGAPAGPLEGIPVGVKDFVDVAGYVTRAGTGFLVRRPDDDSAVVARLRGAGALVVGKTRATELGLSPVGVNPAAGSPRNPHDPRRPCAGSSSGAAAAVAAGLTLVGVGTDYGGSIRMPAAACGVFGLKPTFGRVHVGGALETGCWSLDATGPLARSADDLATAYAVMADVPTQDLGGRARIRAGVDWAWWGVPQTGIDRACRAAVEALEPVGVELAHIGLARAAEYVTVVTGVATAMYDDLRAQPQRFTAATRLALQGAATVTGVDYLRAQQVRALLAATFAQAFERVDVIVTPASALVPPVLDERAWTEDVLDQDLLEGLTAYAFPANLVGLPAVVVPVGVDLDGMPVALQVMAAHGREDLLLRVAHRLERAGVAQVPRPRVWHDLIPATVR